MATLVPPDPQETPPPPPEPENNTLETGQRTATGQFVEGVSGNPHGRPLGVVSKPKKELRAFCRAFVEAPEYRANVLERILAGKAPFIETLIWHYAYGKPPDKLLVEDKRPPFAVLLRKQVEILHEERTLAGPPADSQAEEPPTPELKALPPAPAKPLRRPQVAAPEPEEGNGQGVIWGD